MSRPCISKKLQQCKVYDPLYFFILGFLTVDWGILSITVVHLQKLVKYWYYVKQFRWKTFVLNVITFNIFIKFENKHFHIYMRCNVKNLICLEVLKQMLRLKPWKSRFEIYSNLNRKRLICIIVIRNGKIEWKVSGSSIICGWTWVPEDTST